MWESPMISTYNWCQRKIFIKGHRPLRGLTIISPLFSRGSLLTPGFMPPAAPRTRSPYRSKGTSFRGLRLLSGLRSYV